MQVHHTGIGRSADIGQATAGLALDESRHVIKEMESIGSPAAEITIDASHGECISSSLTLPKSPVVADSLDIRKRFFENILQQSTALQTNELCEKPQSEGGLAKATMAEGLLHLPDNGERLHSACSSISSSAKSACSVDNVNGESLPELQVLSSSKDSSIKNSTHVDCSGEHQLEISNSTEENMVNTDSLTQILAADEGEGRVASSLLPSSSEIQFAVAEADERVKSEVLSAVLPIDMPDRKKALSTFTCASNNGFNVDQEEKYELPVSPRAKCKPFVDIPEFSWSPMHQRLLTELLFSIEADMQVWKT